jgi:8-oxo-dGTP pyrophosphatase MutT (NUDIX family)
LSEFTWPPDASAEGTSSHIPAAVLVRLSMTSESAEPLVVLTRRRRELKRHAGEISFPGGRQDDEDASLTDTALREAEEEIGLARTDVRLLGALAPTATFATNYVIHPFVGVIPAGIAWQPSAREVDAVLELPLGALRAGRTRTRLERRGISFETDAYVVDGHVIWGATARILEHLLERLNVASPGREQALELRSA